MKDVISMAIGSCVLLFTLFSIINGVPDSFGREGIFWDKYPRWMDIVFAMGGTVISIFAAFVSSAIVYCVLDSRRIKRWIIDRLQHYQNRNTHKFY